MAIEKSFLNHILVLLCYECWSVFIWDTSLFQKATQKKKKNEKENVNQIISISPKLPFM